MIDSKRDRKCVIARNHEFLQLVRGGQQADAKKEKAKNKNLCSYSCAWGMIRSELIQPDIYRQYHGGKFYTLAKFYRKFLHQEFKR